MDKYDWKKKFEPRRGDYYDHMLAVPVSGSYKQSVSIFILDLRKRH